MDATAGGGGKGGGGSGLNLHVRSDPQHRAIIHGTVEEEEEEEDDGHVCNPVMGKNGSNFPPHVAVVACSPFLLLETEEKRNRFTLGGFAFPYIYFRRRQTRAINFYPLLRVGDLMAWAEEGGKRNCLCKQNRFLHSAAATPAAKKGGPSRKKRIFPRGGCISVQGDKFDLRREGEFFLLPLLQIGS